MMKKNAALFLAAALPWFVASAQDKEDIGPYTVEDESSAEIRKLTHSPMPVSVIDVTRFHGRNISLNDVLKKVAGVRVKQQGGLGSKSTLAIQGLEGKRVKIFLDGTPVNAPDGTFAINDIPIQFIERIEIYKGVVPAKFGGDASGGAINVVIREWHGSYVDLSLAAGSYGEFRSTFAGKKKFDAYNLELGAGGFYNEAANDYVMDSPYVDGLRIRRKNDDYQSYVLAQVGEANDYWFDAIKWELVRYASQKGIQGIQQEIREAENKSVANIAAFAFEKDAFFHDNLEFVYYLTYVDLELSLIDKATTCYNFDGSERDCPGSGAGEITGLPHDSKDKQEELRHDLNLHYLVNAQHGVNVHVNSQTSKYTPDDPVADEALGFETGRFPSTSTNTVVSLSLESSIWDGKIANDMGVKHYSYDYEITSGSRLVGVSPETNTHDGSEVGFYESIRYELGEGLFVKASYEHAYRLPNTTEIFGDGAFIAPAPNLVPEEADNFNLGILFDRNNVRGMPWLKAEANFFYRDLENMIKLQEGDQKAGYVNLGKIRVSGIELEAKADITDRFYVYANYTNQSLVDKLKYISGTNGVPSPTYNKDVPNVAKQYANVGMEYKIPAIGIDDSMTKFFWETVWSDEYYYGWELSQFQSRKVDAQVSHTAGLEYSFHEDRFIIGAEVRNLTDEKITDVFNYPLMGRTYHVNFRYTWFF